MLIETQEVKPGGDGRTHWTARWLDQRPPRVGCGDTESQAVGNLILAASTDHTSGVDVRRTPTKTLPPVKEGV